MITLRLAAAASGCALLCLSTLHAQIPQSDHYQDRIAVGGTNFNGAGAFNDDDDSDAIPNGLEYLLALLPNDGSGANGALSLPRPSIADDRLRIHFELPEPGATDVTLLVEASDDFGVTDPWTTIATKAAASAWTGPATVTLASAAAGKIAVTVEDIQPVTATPTRFLRLRAEMP